MRRYKCHKEVKAFRIGLITSDPCNNTYLVSEETFKVLEDLVSPIVVTNDWMKKHNPKVGGYLVIYEDGYISYSPAKAFETGYTLIDERKEFKEKMLRDFDEEFPNSRGIFENNDPYDFRRNAVKKWFIKTLEEYVEKFND